MYMDMYMYIHVHVHVHVYVYTCTCLQTHDGSGFCDWVVIVADGTVVVEDDSCNCTCNFASSFSYISFWASKASGY